MQVRGMKGVEALLHQPAGGERQLGVWLQLDSLLELPLPGAAQIELWQYLLQGLEQPSASASAAVDDCRAALLIALMERELTQACTCFEGAAWLEGQRQWRAAVEHQRQLLALQPGAVVVTARLMAGLIQVLARLDQTLTHRQWMPPASPGENARVHGFAAELLAQIDALQQPLPAWYSVVEEGLLRRGALALLQQVHTASRRQGITLLLRLAQRCSPLPDWLPHQLDQAVVAVLADLPQSSQPVAELQALVLALGGLASLTEDQALAAEIDRTLTRAQTTLAVDPEASQQGRSPVLIEPHALRALVSDWLEDHPAADHPVDLELVWIPGARPLPHGPGRLALNLAALMPERLADQQRLEQLMAAFFEPLLQARPGPAWRLRPPTSSLLDALRQVWGCGGALSLADCETLAGAQGLWQRWGGPGVLAATALPDAWPPAPLGADGCLVQPSVAQLSALRCWLLQRPLLEQALAVVRRHHHDPTFMEQGPLGSALDRGDAVAVLSALHVQEGFYASTAAPLDSLQAWAQSSLAVLARSQWLLDLQPPLASWWVVLQGLIQEHNTLPELVTWPGEAAFYRWLAGQEVLLVSPLAAEIEDQHRSGRAFELFLDLPIAPYGLRTLRPPASRYPERPHQSFELSLAACLKSVDALARQRPFSVFLCVAGAYDLPLCAAVRERHGAACLAIGPRLHARFGIEEASTRAWRSAQRRADRWRRIC